MIDEKKNGRRFAKESDRIKRAREKLLARWDEEAKLMSPEALNEIKEKIKNQYHRNMGIRTRITESEKPLRLFAQGEGVQMTASAKVRSVLERIKQEFQQNKEAMERMTLLDQ
jgi:hypothetical protein